MSRILLSVDLSYQLYRACSVHPQLSAPDGTYTGGLYGFMTIVSKAVRDLGVTDVVVCCDRKPYLRTRDYPEYKQIRKQAQDEGLRERVVESEPLVLQLLDGCGWPVWGLRGFESDDLTAQLVTRRRCRYSRIVAMSNDSDLYQLLRYPSFSIHGGTDPKKIVTAASLMRTLGLTPEEYMLATALQGTHNDIAGITGVGETLSRRAVKEPALMRKYRDKHADVIDRNLRLIRLPHPELPRDACPPPRRPPWGPRDLYKWCDRWGIDCTLPMVNAFSGNGT